jgi:hypothetical protein
MLCVARPAPARAPAPCAPPLMPTPTAPNTHHAHRLPTTTRTSPPPPITNTHAHTPRRLPIPWLEKRDGFFTRVKTETELQLQLSKGVKPFLVSHSYGCQVTFTFLTWVEDKHPGWVDAHLAGYVNLAGPTLGLPKALSPLLSGARRGVCVCVCVRVCVWWWREAMSDACVCVHVHVHVCVHVCVHVHVHVHVCVHVCVRMCMRAMLCCGAPPCQPRSPAG